MVSVVVALYNKAPYIRRAIDAISRQTCSDLEIIVVDDGSTDDSRQITLAIEEPRLRLLSQENAGPGAARNAGIAAARGEFVAFLDADDEWAPQYLERCVTLFARYPEGVSVSSAFVREPPGESTVELWRKRGIRDGLYTWSPDMTPRFLMNLVAFTAWTTGTVVRARALAAAGGFFERGTRFGEDSFLLIKLMLIGPVIANVEAIATYHVDASALNRGTRGPRAADAFLQDPTELYALCPPELRPSLDRLLSAFAAKSACVLTYWGRWREARALLRRFSTRGAWSIPYYVPALLATNPAGSLAAQLWRGAGGILRRTQAIGRTKMIATPAAGAASVGERRRAIRVVNLVSSAFYGGPERIMMGIAKDLPPRYESLFFVFGERGRGNPLRGTEMIETATRAGFATTEIVHDFPNLPGMVGEVAGRLREARADLICCHGYKADIVGLAAARLAKIPCVGISHVWVANSKKMSMYLMLDWMALRRMDETVAVCEAQRDRMIARGIRPERITTVRNAIETTPPESGPEEARLSVQSVFPEPKRLIVGTAARLDPEKGIDVFIKAADILHRDFPDVGFVVFGEGRQRRELETLIAERGLTGTFVLAGYRSGAQSLFSGLDVIGHPARDEGLPVSLLEAMLAGVPVVSTYVGGIPEAVVDGVTGYLVASEDHVGLADRLSRLLASPELRETMGARARERIFAEFTFPLQAERYGDAYDRAAALATTAR
jgi:glycosyltransferase involved in cell wall biosynthesis